VYFAGLPATLDNYRLLLRTLAWVARKEDSLDRWFSTNPRTECAWYPEVGKLVVVNNSPERQSTTLLDGEGRPHQVSLAPFGSAWFEPNGPH
jgi:hypothetical protein